MSWLREKEILLEVLEFQEANWHFEGRRQMVRLDAMLSCCWTW